jgi:hypothetical protein
MIPYARRLAGFVFLDFSSCAPVSRIISVSNSVADEPVGEGRKAINRATTIIVMNSPKIL